MALTSAHRERTAVFEMESNGNRKSWLMKKLELNRESAELQRDIGNDKKMVAATTERQIVAVERGLVLPWFSTFRQPVHIVSLGTLSWADIIRVRRWAR